MNREKGPGFIIVVIVMVVLLLFLVRQNNISGSGVSYNLFISDLEKGNVEAVVIRQNREIPTGSVVYKIKDADAQRKVYVTDVNETRDLLLRCV